MAVRSPDLAELEPLHNEGKPVSPASALAPSQDNDLLALTPEMKEFADRYVRSVTTRRQRLMTLHRSLRSSAFVDIDYAPEADGSARDAFDSGRANCLSYAHLFIALARYSGLNARYQSLTLRPEWTRHGDRVALRRHVNVVVRMPDGDQYMVDIDPVRRERVARVEVLSDRQAWALHDNNLAMNHLLEGNLAEAYRSAVRALHGSPKTDYLWVNLGAIYRNAGQNEAAERSYLHALALNPNSRSAMNNLAVLYGELGRLEEASRWTARVDHHRARNPYYHSLLGDRAEQEGDLGAAVKHYLEAIDRAPEDAELYFRTGKLYLALNRTNKAVHYVRLAIEHARLGSQRADYQAYLETLEGDILASLNQPSGRARM